ncbi:hypothetical protein LI142_08305 [Eubacterium limosum]|uniref:hypothetical protein n=1 Tax=Eubacterium limosum TaxID=1736 RepID=UPI001D071931|nr:hypothetical protein [Eubacterium limosum]MCB6569501.1 hypothetical protein [Eubacterium limosum]
MDVPTFFKEYDRMCSYHRNGCDCGDCPLIRFIEDQRGTCLEICKRYPEKSVAIVEQWAKKHPVRTYKSVFLEKFPDAAKEDGVPAACVVAVFGEKKKPEGCYNSINCSDCWNREVEE